MWEYIGIHKQSRNNYMQEYIRNSGKDAGTHYPFPTQRLSPLTSKIVWLGRVK